VTPAWVVAALFALPPDFEAFLARVDAAQTELQNGRAGSFKALWSHSEDVTLSGGLGGPILRGWPAVSKRLDWVATQFSDGTHENDRVTAHATADVGYVVQRERLRIRGPAGDRRSMEYRVTMIFRREKGEWRLVHRQADASTADRPSR
jgi:ketosteroid isomerase-like protein